MISPKVSIITPVYNAEKFLHKYVDSIIAQTLTDWELILVDDGSTDSSGEICDQYASQDSRIRVIHKKNAGVSAARQDGIDAALGEYTIHADSDDWVEPTMLEELYAKAKVDDADMVICDYYTNTDNNQVLNIQKPTDVADNALIIRDLFQQLHGSCWNKLVRRACYSLYDVKFPQGLNYCEDQLTIVRLLTHPVKVSYLNRAFYHYNDNPASITRNYQRPQYETRIRFAELLEESLPVELRESIIRRVRFNIFVEATIYNVLNNGETNRGLVAFRSEISKLGLRWRLGFWFLQKGFSKIAHRLIRY